MAGYTFCPQCAAPLQSRLLYGRERACCPACGFIHFREPRLAVGALVVQEGRVLLVRRAVPPRKGFWAVPSGYVEYDEEPRMALAREVHEETGLRVEVGRVIDVFPNADPTKPGVFLLFEATTTDASPTPGDDVSAAAWFSRTDLPRDRLAFEGDRAILRLLEERLYG